MSKDSSSDYKRRLRVKLSRPDVGDVAEGTLTYGYGCLAHLRIDWRGPELRLTSEQLATGLLAVAEKGQRLCLFNCEQDGHSLYPEFVTEGDPRVGWLASGAVISSLGERYALPRAIAAFIGYRRFDQPTGIACFPMSALLIFEDIGNCCLDFAFRCFAIVCYRTEGACLRCR